jgi:colanic acid/amylovoran biosynthesis protein
VGFALKIAVTNAVLSNSGDAAIFEAILSSLQEAGVADPANVFVFDANARVTSKLYPSWTIFQQLTVSPPRRIARVRSQLQKVRLALVEQLLRRPAQMAKLLRLPLVNKLAFARSHAALSTADVVISSGGTYLVDHYNFNPRVSELQLARQNDATIVLWTQSLGPFKADRAQAAIKKIAAVTDSVYFRDPRSSDAWEQTVPFPPMHSVVPDAVFALPVNSTMSGSRGHDAGANRRAFISVREWSHGVDSEALAYDKYETMLRAGASKLLDLGWKVEALSTCQGVPSYPFDDSKIAEKIFTGMGVDINSHFHRPQSLLAELLDTDLVITTRMHLAILSLVSQVPVIAIAYEFKTLELFASLGLEDFVIRIEDANSDWLRARIDQIGTNPMSAVLSDSKLIELRKLAQLPAHQLKAVIDSRTAIL